MLLLLSLGRLESTYPPEDGVPAFRRASTPVTAYTRVVKDKMSPQNTAPPIILYGDCRVPLGLMPVSAA